MSSLTLLKTYIKYHPLKEQLTAGNIPFLVYYNQKPVKDNGITRILNKIFGKKIGSSMLRHIYLSSKYGNLLEDQKIDLIVWEVFQEIIKLVDFGGI